MGRSLDDALKGDLEAIGVNLCQMIGALNWVNTDKDAAFVQPKTLDEVARVILSPYGARDARPGPTAPEFDIGQNVTLRVSSERDGRVMLALVNKKRAYLYMAPPKTAVLMWAEARVLDRADG